MKDRELVVALYEVPEEGLDVHGGAAAAGEGCDSS